MPQRNNLLDRVFYANRCDYTVQQGNIAYLDGKPLRRPFKMPIAQRGIGLLIMIAAVIIGFIVVNSTILESMRAAETAQQTIEENLKRTESIETIPMVADYATLSDEDILAKFEEDKVELFDASAEGDGNGLVLYRVAPDMTADQVAALYAQGLSAISTVDASKLLTGSWSFTTDRLNNSLVVRYVDFSSKTPQAAVQRALDKEGFDSEKVEDSGVDESGNTYTTGTVSIDDKDYTWKISAIPLTDIYSISGLPENACYVGVRIDAVVTEPEEEEPAEGEGEGEGEGEYYDYYYEEGY